MAIDICTTAKLGRRYKYFIFLILSSNAHWCFPVFQYILWANGSLKFSRSNTKRRQYESYQIFTVKSKTDLKSELTKAIFISVTKPKLRKAKKCSSLKIEFIFHIFKGPS